MPNNYCRGLARWPRRRRVKRGRCITEHISGVLRTLLVMLVVPTWGGFQPPQTPLVKDGFMRYMLVFVAVNVVLNI